MNYEEQLPVTKFRTNGMRFTMTKRGIWWMAAEEIEISPQEENLEKK